MLNITKKFVVSGVALSSLVSFIFLATTARAVEFSVDNVRVTTAIDNAAVSWTTDVTTTGTFDYGTESGTYSKSVSTDSDTSHYISLSNLEPGTKYYYRITATALDDTEATSGEKSFITLPKDLALISSEVVARGSDKIIIKTTANRRALITIAYGTAEDALTSTSESSDFSSTTCSAEVVNHNLLKGLKASTMYFYQITLREPESDCVGDSTAITYSIKQAKTTGAPVITSITPKSRKVGTMVTIRGKNFDQGMSKGHMPIDTAIAFGCNLNNWPRVTSRTPETKCLGYINSWSDTKIVATVLKSGTTGPIYIGKAYRGASYKGWSHLKLFIIKGPKLTVIR